MTEVAAAADEPRRSLAAAIAAPLVLALWLGAAIFFAAVVARAAFAVLPTRALAGALVGRTLPILLLAGVAAGIIAMAIELGCPERSARRRSLAALGVAICCAAAIVVGQHIDRLRSALGGSLDALAAGDPARVAFGRWHALSVVMLGLAMLLAAVTIVSGLRRHG